MNLSIKCPLCSKKGFLDKKRIDEMLRQTSKGILTLNIAKEHICSHSFVIYLDKNGEIRDYLYTDFQVELPTFKIREEIHKDLLVFDVKKVKDIISPPILVYLIRSCLLKKDCILIIEKSEVIQIFRDFFHILFDDNFGSRITILSKSELENAVKKYKKFSIFNLNKVIKDNGKIIKKNGKIENRIVQTFFEDSNIIVLRNEIRKIYKLIKILIEYLDSFDKNHEKKKIPFPEMNFIKHLVNPEKVVVSMLIDHFRQTHKIKITKIYLFFLFEILQFYYGRNLAFYRFIYLL